MRRTLPLLLIALFLWPAAAFAQSLVGTWEGAIQTPGEAIEIIVTFTDDDGLAGTIDIPIQNLRGRALGDVSQDGATVSFTIPEVPGLPTFTGTLDGDELAGAFKQGGFETTFALTRQSAQDAEADAARLAAALDSVRAVIPRLLDALDVPGVAVAIVTSDDVLMQDGFGLRDVEGNQPVTPHTLFAIGSSTKAFTATALGTLIDDGDLKWDTPVKDLLPTFQLHDTFATNEMTARDLLTHRSGLPRHDLMWYGSGFSRKEIFERMRYLEASEPFRTRFQYQNLMFMTAGYLAGDLTHSSWEAVVQDRLFTPLGMTHSNFSVDVMDDAPDFAYGYTWDEDAAAFEKMPFRNIDAIGPAGSINAPLVDMVKWAQFQLSDGTFGGQNILEESTLREIQRPQFLLTASLQGHTPIQHYAMGWFVDVFKGEILTHHGGNIDGFSAMVAFLPQHDYGFVILTNKNGTPLNTLLLRTAVEHLVDLDKTDWLARAMAGTDDDDDEEAEDDEEEAEDGDDAVRIAGTSPSRPLAEYAGTYTHPGYGDVTISANGDLLGLKLNGIEGDFAHFHYDVFQMDSDVFGKMKVQFMLNIDGQIDALKLAAEPTLPALTFERQADAALRNPAYLAQFVGKYQIPNGPQVSIFIQGDDLMAEVPGQPVYTLVPVRDAQFELADLDGYAIRFESESGTVVSAVMSQPGGSVRVKKVE